jgi:glutathione S-transferase
VRLLGSLASPYVRKVRVVLHEKGLDCPLEIEDVWSPTTAIGRFNPLGKVPCLVLEDGECVFDSRVIVQTLEDLRPDPPLLPHEATSRRRVLTWEALADGMLDAGVLVRLESTQRPEDKRHEPWIARQRAKVEAALDWAERALGERPWLVGERFSLADVALGCATGWLAFRLPDLLEARPRPALAAYRARLEERPSFRLTRPS